MDEESVSFDSDDCSAIVPFVGGSSEETGDDGDEEKYYYCMYPFLLDITKVELSVDGKAKVI